MELTKCSRAALIATFNTIASARRSEWLLLPIDDGKCGFVFVHKRAVLIFGATIQTADLFSSGGEASRLATEIYWIASGHGWIAHDVEKTRCDILLGATEAEYFPRKITPE